jgi:hypothetical protein
MGLLTAKKFPLLSFYLRLLAASEKVYGANAIFLQERYCIYHHLSAKDDDYDLESLLFGGEIQGHNFTKKLKGPNLDGISILEVERSFTSFLRCQKAGPLYLQSPSPQEHHDLDARASSNTFLILMVPVSPSGLISSIIVI